MVLQSVVVIQDASKEIHSNVFHWAINGLSLKAGDNLKLVVVLYQVITPLGCKISVDGRLGFGANQKIIEEQVARKKEEYMKNEELAHIYKLYKSMKVGFNIEIAMGSSPKTVALKSATKLKATWVILDRKMKNDEEYFLQKLSCGISRIRSSNRIVHLRGPLDTPQQKRRNSRSELYADSTPQDFSTELDLFSIDIFSNSSHINNYEMNQEEEQQRQKRQHEEVECLTLENNQTVDINPYQLSMDENDAHSKQLLCQIQRDQQWQDKEQKENEHREKELKENNSKMHEQESLSTKVYQKSERYLCFGGARNFFLGGNEEYKVSEQVFSLSNFHIRN